MQIALLSFLAAAFSSGRFWSAATQLPLLPSIPISNVWLDCGALMHSHGLSYILY
jgi:hypothetical protein